MQNALQITETRNQAINLLTAVLLITKTLAIALLA